MADSNVLAVDVEKYEYLLNFINFKMTDTSWLTILVTCGSTRVINKSVCRNI